MNLQACSLNIIWLKSICLQKTWYSQHDAEWPLHLQNGSYVRKLWGWILLGTIVTKKKKWSLYKCLYPKGPLLTLSRMDFWGLLPKICHTYPAMIKLDTVVPYLKKIQKKYMNHVIHTLRSADISVLLTISPEINKFCYIKKYRYRLYLDS